MNMPGFTAGSSLYRSSAHYVSASAHVGSVRHPILSQGILDIRWLVMPLPWFMRGVGASCWQGKCAEPYVCDGGLCRHPCACSTYPCNQANVPANKEKIDKCKGESFHAPGDSQGNCTFCGLGGAPCADSDDCCSGYECYRREHKCVPLSACKGQPCEMNADCCRFYQCKQGVCDGCTNPEPCEGKTCCPGYTCANGVNCRRPSCATPRKKRSLRLTGIATEAPYTFG